MKIVIISACGIGGATIVGGILGLLLKRLPDKMNDSLLGFSAGIMLAAALFGLLMPALENAVISQVFLCCFGIISGALFLRVADFFTPILHKFAGVNIEDGTSVECEQLNKVLLFVTAIAIHNLPEGLAAGVAFGTDDIHNGISIAIGIALQNIPEGMVVIAPLLMAGVSKGRTLGFSIFTGSTEILGTLIGFVAVHFCAPLLPFALGFAGGTIIHIISDEMIPEIHERCKGLAKYSLISGFVVMTVFSFI